MARNPDWAKHIVDRHTRDIMGLLAHGRLPHRERVDRVRSVIRACIRETVRATSGEMQGLIQDQLEKVVPQYTTQEAAARLGIALSTFRLYIAQKIVQPPDKVANTFLWSEEKVEETRQRIASYRAGLRRSAEQE